MRFLLDTHVYTWLVLDESRLSWRAREAVEDPRSELLISAVVPWELATKWRLGKWPEAPLVLDDLETALAERTVEAVPITLSHARHAGLIQAAHRDPFDRILAAQAQLEGAPLVTADPAFREMGVEIVW